MPRISELFPSRFLKAPDLKGRAVPAKIDKVETELLGEKEKAVLSFENKQKKLVLNKTNANTLAVAYGDDTDRWPGKPVVLRPTMVDMRGVPTPSIRVEVPGFSTSNSRLRPTVPNAPMPSEMPEGPEDPDDEIPY